MCFYSFWVAWQYPWGSFCVFCSPNCHRCFCIPASFVASLLSSLSLGPRESCAVAVNASAIALRPRNLPRALHLLLFYRFGGSFWRFHIATHKHKSLTSENSRDQNEECAFLEFFDWHDLWHFLSSFAVLVATIVVMLFSSEPVQKSQASEYVMQGRAV